MSIQTMGGVLQQMNVQALQASGPTTAPFSTAVAGKNTHFPDILLNSNNTNSAMQTHAKNQAQDYMLGTSKVGLNDVMVDLQKSTVALNFGVQVRNKLVSAYQEVMSMAV